MSSSGGPAFSSFKPEVRRLLPWIIGLRWLVDVAARSFFAFLPAFSRATGIQISELGTMLFARDMIGLGGPVMGKIADRSGAKRVMLVGATALAIGLLLLPFGYWGVVVGLGVSGLGNVAYGVSLKSWVGDEVAYENRGKASAQIEMTWAFAALVGLPLAGTIISRYGWNYVPIILASLMLPFVLRLSLLFKAKANLVDKREASVRPTIDLSGWAVLVALTVLNFASQLLVFSHGIWLEAEFGFDAASVGFAVLLIGAAELLASFTCSRFSDQIGKRRSAAAGLAISTVALLTLAVMASPGLVVGIGFLALAFLGFEFAVVSFFPLISEIDPKARAAVIGRSVGLSIVARASGTLLASMLLADLGFRPLMAIASVLALVAVVLTTVLGEEP